MSLELYISVSVPRTQLENGREDNFTSATPKVLSPSHHKLPRLFPALHYHKSLQDRHWFPDSYMSRTRRNSLYIISPSVILRYHKTSNALFLFPIGPSTPPEELVLARLQDVHISRILPRLLHPSFPSFDLKHLRPALVSVSLAMTPHSECHKSAISVSQTVLPPFLQISCNAMVYHPYYLIYKSRLYPS